MLPSEGGEKHLVGDTKGQWFRKRRMVTGQRLGKGHV
jgi:hypothetical protein